MKTIYAVCPAGKGRTGRSVLSSVRLAFIVLVLGLLGLMPAYARTPQIDSPVAGADPFDLAARYENGESVRRDYYRARRLYCEAAAKGDPRALLALAWVFMNGRGVPRDDQAAAFWLRRAAAAHVPQAVTLLGVLRNIRPVDRGCVAEGRAAIASREGTANGSLLTQGSAECREAIEQAAAGAGVTLDLLSAMVSVESGYDAAAVSPKGAVGLMQLMPATAERFHVMNVFDCRENLRGGAAYIRILLDKFGGDLNFALAAYNAGEKAVDTYHGVPPYAETRAYIATVTRLCSCGNAPLILPTMLVQSDKAPP